MTISRSSIREVTRVSDLDLKNCDDDCAPFTSAEGDPAADGLESQCRAAFPS